MDTQTFFSLISLALVCILGVAALWRQINALEAKLKLKEEFEARFHVLEKTLYTLQGATQAAEEGNRQRAQNIEKDARAQRQQIADIGAELRRVAEIADQTAPGRLAKLFQPHKADPNSHSAQDRSQ